jgi:farnesyl-diphosphate farnesyltransferase
MRAPATDLLAGLLRDVSRSFYLTLRLLPCAVRRPIGTAYLLARATDTLADTDVLPVAERLSAMELLRERILGGNPTPLDFRLIAESHALAAERELLSRIEEVMTVLNEFPCFDRCCVREVITTITSGQELDLQRFHHASRDRVIALSTQRELDDYTFRVAGCVGGFWTRICRSHLYPEASLDLPRYLEDGVRFGKGLQCVNILRDLPADLKHGRCYLPEESLSRHGLSPCDLLDPASELRFRPVMREHLERAAGYLRAGWRYTCCTPRQQIRVRIACALPLLIGSETLRLLAQGNVLDSSRRFKVPRRQVKLMLARTIVLHPFRHWWEQLFSAELPPDPCRGGPKSAPGAS